MISLAMPDIELMRVCKSYGGRSVLQDLCHRFPGGQISCVLGPSGCGKTTLLRLIAGLEAPDGGEIRGAAGWKISAVFQEDRLLENLTAEKNLLLTARPGFTRKDAQGLLEQLGLNGAARQRTSLLSGGMRRRVAVARALAADYDLLLLDEPLTGLDGETRLQVLRHIQRACAGRTTIWVTHGPQVPALLGAPALQLSRIPD